MLVGLRSRRLIEPFSLHQPDSVAEALALYRQPGSNAFLAGGIDLIDWLKHGHAIDRLIRLDGLPELTMITGDQDQLCIGAMATHDAIAGSRLIRDLLPDLPRLWNTVANPRVRFTGTIGGNVMANRPDYDAHPALLALGAHATSGVETTPAALDKINTLVTSFIVPSPASQRLFTDRSLRPAVSIWLGLTVMGGHVAAMRVAIGMAHPVAVCVTLHPNVPMSDLGPQSASLAEQVTREMPEPMSDSRASASYRRRMVGVLTRRILLQAGSAA